MQKGQKYVVRCKKSIHGEDCGFDWVIFQPGDYLTPDGYNTTCLENAAIYKYNPNLSELDVHVFPFDNLLRHCVEEYGFCHGETLTKIKKVKENDPYAYRDVDLANLETYADYFEAVPVKLVVVE